MKEKSKIHGKKLNPAEINDLILDYEILPKTHSPMYLMHKYWARKPANIVANYIKRYCPQEGIVLDPFMGSGVTILESIFSNRLAIGIDVNPMANFITKNTGIYADIYKLETAFQIIKNEVEKKNSIFSLLYEIQCDSCKNSKAIITHIIWLKKKEDLNHQIEEIRYKCSNCGEIVINNSDLNSSFISMKEFILNQEINALTFLSKDEIKNPNVSFKYTNNQAFIQLRHNLRKQPELTELFTQRNYAFLVFLIHIINKLSDNYENEKELLKFCFTSSLAQASKMVWVINKRKGKALKKKQVGSWTHHFFWDPSNFFEVNAWNCFKHRYSKLKNGKIDSNKRNKNSNSTFKLADSFSDLSIKKPVLLWNTSSTKLELPNNTVDFVFTDPPYGDSIQYGELSTLWNAWLDVDMDRYKKKMELNEIIINTHQGKNLKSYEFNLKKVFSEIFRVLKPDKYMVLTFHNTSFKIRNALINSVVSCGFELCQILFQLPPRVSIKSMLHHEGSPIGDYYIRFQKPLQSLDDKKKTKLKTLDNEEIYKIIKDKISEILKKRGEPTNFMWISNFLDEMLYKSHIFPIDNLEFYITRLKNSNFFHISKEGKWWFTHDSIPKDCEKPLTAQIEDFLEIYLKDHWLDVKLSDRTKKQKIFNEIYRKFRGVYSPDKFETNQIIEKS
ncbi:DNA methyltransferase [Promethearchaeum syntrophicum]|uniref:DNA methyltransferase n=1 Tax=Promethearchaeum syntrophicum TaxID=2594042 RepID=A0A5B9D684_9ARCH|nr:DNA methyltransferase [Candidatus Prometheoarchaeum syntrophicum]QEE14542.1 putative methyltransferase [Candidatus Prometheoarchaeum syntrophicum]